METERVVEFPIVNTAKSPRKNQPLGWDVPQIRSQARWVKSAGIERVRGVEKYCEATMIEIEMLLHVLPKTTRILKEGTKIQCHQKVLVGADTSIADLPKYDPSNKLTARQALRHRFFGGSFRR
ncbi:hypothetical protein QQ045_000657 [Rhodiola kirilowii]